MAQIGAAQALDRPPQALAAALHQMNLAGYAAVEGPLKEAVLDRLGGKRPRLGVAATRHDFRTHASRAGLFKQGHRCANLRDIATARGAAVATVRNQVKSVMAKAGVRRQPELVARLLAYL
ncbi:MAG: hypothetical protein Q7T23_15540 [Phenylobacterium sp.]|nr:hypothetical protein [Phenylobacterium sp.]